MHLAIRAREEETQTISVELSANEVTEYLRGFYLAVAQSAGLKPERGLSAKQLVERELDSDEISRSASEMVATRATATALDEAGIDAIGLPDYGCQGYAQEGRPFTFDILATLKPHVELSSYDPIELPAPSNEVTEEAVDAFIARVAHYHPDTIVDSSKDTIEEKSLVSLSMETLRNKKRFEHLCFDEREYQLGQGAMPSGFDEGLVGAHVGETLTITFEAEDATRNPTGKLPVFSYTSKVTVKARLTHRTPTIDDAWVARNITSCSSVKQLRDRARQELQQQANEQSLAYLKYRAADALAERLQVPVPDAAFAAYYAELLKDFRTTLFQQDLTEENYLHENGLSADELRHRMMSQARAQLRQGLALDALARHRKITVTHSELKAYLDETSQGQHDELLRNLKTNGGMRKAEEAALRAKANDWLVQTARTA